MRVMEIKVDVDGYLPGTPRVSFLEDPHIVRCCLFSGAN